MPDSSPGWLGNVTNSYTGVFVCCLSCKKRVEIRTSLQVSEWRGARWLLVSHGLGWICLGCERLCISLQIKTAISYSWGEWKTVKILSWGNLSTLSRFLGRLTGLPWMGSPVACACTYVLELGRSEGFSVVVPAELQWMDTLRPSELQLG